MRHSIRRDGNPCHDFLGKQLATWAGSCAGIAVVPSVSKVSTHTTVSVWRHCRTAYNNKEATNNRTRAHLTASCHIGGKFRNSDAYSRISVSRNPTPQPGKVSARLRVCAARQHGCEQGDEPSRHTTTQQHNNTTTQHEDICIAQGCHTAVQ